MNSIRHAFRALLKNPGFTAIAVVALGIGIGANSAMYSLADALLFRPLMLPEIDRAVAFGGVVPGDPELNEISPADLFDFRSWSRTLDHVSAINRARFNLTGGAAEPEVILAARVSPSFFDALNTKPTLGRAFLPDEEQPGRDRVAVIGQHLWERRFGADPAVLTRTVELNGETYNIVGVMPAEVRFPPDAELWVPLAFTPAQRDERARGSFYLNTVARLKAGVTIDQARTEFAALAKRLSEAHPQTHAKRSADVQLFRIVVSGYYTYRYVGMLLGAVAFLLLLACTNVANLHYARISARSRDLAIRAALGAGRLRIIRELLTESAALGLLGAFAGIFFAAWGMDLIRRGMPAEIEIYLPGWQRIGVNTRIVLFTAAVAIASGILAGLLSAFTGSRVNLVETLKDSGRGTTAGASRHRVRSVLVVTQMILAIVLLAGAGLMVRGFQALSSPRPAIEPQRLYTMRIALSETRYPKRDSLLSFAQRLQPKLESLPGVEMAALSSNLPYVGGRSSSTVTIEYRPEPAPGESFSVQQESVTPAFFSTMRIPVVRGRAFTEGDGENAPLVGVVNEAFVRRQFANENPIGKRVKVSPFRGNAPWVTIVGIAVDVRHSNIDRSIRPLLYRPIAQTPPRSFYAVIRTRGDANAIAAPARAAVYSIDATQPVFRPQTYQKVVEQHMTGIGYVTSLMGIFGVLALALSAIGIYSVIAFSVTERTHEIGVRMALGASRSDVQWEVMRGGLALTFAGLAIGLTLAYGLARLLAGLFFGVSATDLTAFATVSLVLVASAALACWLPARRASRVDPIIALRE